MSILEGMLDGHRRRLNDQYSMELGSVASQMKMLECDCVVSVDTCVVPYDDDGSFYLVDVDYQNIFACLMLSVND